MKYVNVLVIVLVTLSVASAGEILFTEREIREKLLGLSEEGCVLVTHLPPKNSKLDLAEGRHIGSSAVMETILQRQPSIHLCVSSRDMVPCENRMTSGSAKRAASGSRSSGVT